MKFLYIFGFETPNQRALNSANGWDDEDSGSVVIEADTAEAALYWGRIVAEGFLKWLYGNARVSWAAGRYADSLEAEPMPTFAPDQMRGVVTVRAGQMPDLAKLTAHHEPPRAAR